MATTPSGSPKTFKDFERMFPDETAAKTYLTMRRWPDGPVCPKCGNTKVYTLKARPFNWLCKSETCLKRTKTGYRFSLYVGTTSGHYQQLMRNPVSAEATRERRVLGQEQEDRCASANRDQLRS